MRTTLGQPVIVENIPGADRGIIKVIRAEPDGYTLGLGGWAPYVLRPLVFSLPFDLQKDLEPVAFLADAPFWILSKKDIPAKNMAEFIAWLKANSGKASAGTTGAGGGSHLCGLYLQNTTGPSFQFIPYRGGAPALQDLVGGQIDFYCDLAANSLPQVRAGNIKAFAMMAKTRWPAAPEIPTGDEAGLPAFYISNWTGIWAPPERRKPSSTRSTERSRHCLPIRMSASAMPNWDKSFRRRASRPPKRSAPSTRPKSRSGHRSSRRRTSSPTERTRPLHDATTIPSIAFPGGETIPVLGQGTWQMAEDPRAPR